MPDWAALVGGIAATLIALGIIWQKAIKPGAQVISRADRALPVMKEFVDTFEGKTSAFAVLQQIADQFKTDSGSTLRDVVNRLEAQSLENARVNEKTKAVSDQLAIALEATRQLGERDREVLQRVVIMLDRLGVKTEDAAMRAGAVPDDAAPGEAADAAMRPPEDTT